MSAILLKLLDDGIVTGMTTRDGIQVFSLHDFIKIVCQKNELYAKRLWRQLKCTCNFTEFSLNITMLKHKTPGMTIMGLQRLLNILNKRVDVHVRPIVEDVFARYMSGDTSMIIEADVAYDNTLFNTKLHGNLLSLHYNFEPPKTTMHTKQKK